MSAEQISIETWLPEARQMAAQCWCTPETSDIKMDPRLAEAVAYKIAAWMDTGAFHARNEAHWRERAEKAEAAHTAEPPINAAAQADLFAFLAHGDTDHRMWLAEAIEAFYAGKPRPEPKAAAPNEPVAPLPSAPINEDLAVLVRKLAYSLRKANPEHTLPDQAMEYLREHNLQGSPLRAERASPQAVPAEPVAVYAFDGVCNGFTWLKRPNKFAPDGKPIYLYTAPQAVDAPVAPPGSVPPAPAWIPVSERLPARGVDFIALNHDGRVFWSRSCHGMHEPLFTYQRGDKDASDMMPAWVDVTHWMPLPTHPLEAPADSKSNFGNETERDGEAAQRPNGTIER